MLCVLAVLMIISYGSSNIVHTKGLKLLINYVSQTCIDIICRICHKFFERSS